MSKSLNAPLACLIGIAALIGTLTLAGCATVPMASMEQDSAAKGFATPPDLSRIYLYRNKSFGGAIPLTVSLDGKTMGQTGPNTYFVWDVSPGEHTVTSYSEDVSTLNLTTAPGRAYYIWQEVKRGLWSAQSQLQEVDEATGRSGVLECKLAQSAQ
jgi:hypothetical protein